MSVLPFTSTANRAAGSHGLALAEEWLYNPPCASEARRPRGFMTIGPCCLVGLLGLLLLGGCSRSAPSPAEKVSGDVVLQAKFEAARRALEDIGEGKQSGRNVYADCKTTELLYSADLERLAAPAAKKVLSDLRRICAEAKAP